jgi:hypothetical protein
VDQLLDLVGGDLFARPRLLPARLRLRDGGLILAHLGAGARAVFRPEDVLEEGHSVRARGARLHA